MSSITELCDLYAEAIRKLVDSIRQCNQSGYLGSAFSSRLLGRPEHDRLAMIGMNYVKNTIMDALMKSVLPLSLPFTCHTPEIMYHAAALMADDVCLGHVYLSLRLFELVEGYTTALAPAEEAAVVKAVVGELALLLDSTSDSERSQTLELTLSRLIAYILESGRDRLTYVKEVVFPEYQGPTAATVPRVEAARPNVAASASHRGDGLLEQLLMRGSVVSTLQRLRLMASASRCEAISVSVCRTAPHMSILRQLHLTRTLELLAGSTSKGSSFGRDCSEALIAAIEGLVEASTTCWHFENDQQLQAFRSCGLPHSLEVQLTALMTDRAHPVAEFWDVTSSMFSSVLSAPLWLQSYGKTAHIHSDLRMAIADDSRGEASGDILVPPYYRVSINDNDHKAAVRQFREGSTLLPVSARVDLANLAAAGPLG
ncbi:MAG: hypothetical protein KVP17_003171 [Porospora cf. gigantea B]|uniref:uncharacterized protein n=1 Tax=Porospora cf. gigantea B TaxID=2853592 RepID=UPI0035719677|nr:MAG: hypothetical protein KVP17_003171 [Porospora cf. gigantea B]